LKGSNEFKIDLAFKICIFGDSGVGKTTLVDRYLTEEFHDDIRSTLGATIQIKILKLKNGKVTLQIWDFGGEEKFRFIFPAYARGSSGGIYMFDLTNRASISNINNWLSIFREVSDDCIILLVGSKLDLEQERVFSKEDTYDLMRLYKFDNYVECSSKTGENVLSVFTTLISEILDKIGEKQVEFI
jgi:small GTP-binding protein